MFWLDSDVYMQAKNLYYAFDIAPGFWDIVSTSAADGTIRSPMMVYKEITTGADALATWANLQKSADLFVDPDKTVQEQFSVVADYVTKEKQFGQAHVSLFLKGADPWVVASAIAESGTVVTHEKLVGTDSTRVKIPNVCKKFGVEWITCYEMLRRLGYSLKV